MLTLPSSIRVFLAPGATDMRRSFDGLAATARRALALDPLSGDLFVFCNRRRTILKALLWEDSGFWVFAKRLEQGTFSWPRPRRGERHIEMRSAELSLLLGGIDLAGSRRRRWYDRPPTAGKRPPHLDASNSLSTTSCM
jgi:transposase